MMYLFTSLFLFLYVTQTQQRVTFFNPVSLNWVNCYSPNCASWRSCPTISPERVCLKFQSGNPFAVTNSSGHIVKVKLGNGTVDFTDVRDFLQSTSYSFQSAETDHTGGLQTCFAKSLTTTGLGLTSMDCCINNNLPTCGIFSGIPSTQTLPVHLSCVHCYFGYGSCYGTACEAHAFTESPFAIRSAPASGGFLHDFGHPRNDSGVGCYIENWSKYRPVPHKYDYETPLPYCTRIYYAFAVAAIRGSYVVDGLREPHDAGNLRSYSSKLPTYLTIGGWTANGTILDTMVQDATSITKLVALANAYNLDGIDIDWEWPGQRGSNPLLLDDIYLWCGRLCDALHAVDKRCAFGVLPLGSPYDPRMITALVANADKFNVFGYDFHGGWENYQASQSQVLPLTRPGAASQYSIKVALTHMSNLGALHLVSLGLPTYSRGYMIDSLSFDASILSAGPTEDPMLGPGESGSSMIQPRSRDYAGAGHYVPTACDVVGAMFRQDPNDTCAMQCIAPASGSTFVMMNYLDLAGLACIVDYARNAFGVRDFYVYACSMNPDFCNAVGKHILVKPIEQRSVVVDSNFTPPLLSIFRSALRTRRALTSTAQTVYYSYPSPAVTTPTSCPGILVFGETLVVTNIEYLGCYKTANTSPYCWYKKSSFGCSPPSTSNPLIVMERVSNDDCSGVSTATLLPTISGTRKVCLVSGDITFVVAQLTICSDSPAQPINRQEVLSVSNSLSNTFGSMKEVVYGDLAFGSDAIFVPASCGNFSMPLSCVASVCGVNQQCVSTLSSLGLSGMCESTSGILTEYENKLIQLRKVNTQTSYLRDEIIKYASSMLPTVHRERRFLGAISLGLSIANSIAIVGVGISHHMLKVSTNKRFDRVEGRVNQVIKKLDDVSENVNNLRDDLANALTQQHTHNKVVQEAVNKLSTNQQSLTNKLNTLGVKVSAAINTLGTDLATLTSTVRNLGMVSSAINVYTNELIIIMAKASGAIDDGLFYNSLLFACLNTLKKGDLSGCVHSSGDINGVTFDIVNTTGGVHLVFGYLYREKVGYLSTQAASVFCSNSTLYIAPQGCMFTLVDAQVILVTKRFEPCDSSAQTSEIDCSLQTNMSIINPRPLPIFNFTTFSLNISKPEPPTSINYTSLALNLVNITTIPDLQAIIDSILADKLPVGDIPYLDTNVQGTTLTVLELVLVCLGAVALLGIIIALISCVTKQKKD